MESLVHASDSHRNSAFTRFGGHLSISLPSPLPILLDLLSGFVRSRAYYESRVSSMMFLQSANAPTQVEIRIIGEQDEVSSHGRNTLQNTPLSTSALPGDDATTNPTENPHSLNNQGFEVSGVDVDNREPLPQIHDFQPFSTWIEQVLPFAVLLLMVFIREHLQCLAIILWTTAVMMKANELLRKQAALKGKRKTWMLGGIGAVLVAHVFIVYWLYRKDASWILFLLHLPRAIPRFWEAVLIVIVNDMMACQAFMVLKCGLLLSYNNSRGRDSRRLAQLLTLIEYLLLLYRALLPAPVWYRFFLNKKYGNLFSPLATGFYLTFKLTSILEKIKMFVIVARAVSGQELQYGAYATIEEVLAAGDLCAICRGKMQSPISLSCKHLFCEDCVSEWFERERTCPLCRAVVNSADLRCFADASTCLCVQIF